LYKTEKGEWTISWQAASPPGQPGALTRASPLRLNLGANARRFKLIIEAPHECTGSRGG